MLGKWSKLFSHKRGPDAEDTLCHLAPLGWVCDREKGHDGMCSGHREKFASLARN